MKILRTDSEKVIDYDIRIVPARKSLGPSLGRTLTPTDGSRSLRYIVVNYYRIILALLLAGKAPR